MGNGFCLMSRNTLDLSSLTGSKMGLFGSFVENWDEVGLCLEDYY